MNGIKAIETRYKGYRFRSRLEARWAVFFDTLGVKWEYEKEGYDLGKLGWYLPDFWLPRPEWGLWVEIKPREASCDEKQKCQALSLLTNSIVVLVAGSPWPEEYDISVFDTGRHLTKVDNSQREITQWALWGESKSTVNFFGKNLGIVEQLDSGKRGYGLVGPENDLWLLSGQGVFFWPATDNNFSDDLLMKAYTAARSARFEHGENGEYHG